MVRSTPIVSKKSASVSTVEKFAPEIEICVFSRRFTTRISLSSTQNRCFYLSVSESFGQPDFFNTIGHLMPLTTGHDRPRLCKNVFERDRYSKPDCKSRFYAKSTSADVPINFRFNVNAHTSILAKRFYTLWAKRGLSPEENHSIYFPLSKSSTLREIELIC